jgi:hypothetical protein
MSLFDHKGSLDRLIEFAKLYQPAAGEAAPEGDLPFKEGQTLDYVVQEHHAKRAGKHLDIRIGDRSGMYSWATKKHIAGALPEGGKVLLHPQPIHPQSYNDFEGEIKSGYGAGVVKTRHIGSVLITKSEPGQTNSRQRGGSHRMALIKRGNKHLLVREKNPEAPEGAEKPTFKSVAPDKAADVLQEGALVQPKIDGALVYVTTKGGRPEIFSHRRSKLTGKHIVHTERVLGGRPRLDIPKEHQGAVLAELYGKKDGKVIDPQELGGILNAHIDEAIKRQKEKGIQLKLAPFDVVGEKGRYQDRLQRANQIAQHLGDVVETPETVPATQARGLIKQIAAGKHPLTKEGVIVRGPSGKDVKLKNVAEEDVRIHDVLEKGNLPVIGGFTYAG